MRKRDILLLLKESVLSFIAAMPPIIFLMCTSEFSSKNIITSLISKCAGICGIILPDWIISRLNIFLFCTSLLLMMLINSVRLFKQHSAAVSGKETQQKTLKDLMKAACLCIRNQIVECSGNSVGECDSLRVSLYIIVPNGSKGEKGFSCCGRYSKNLRYAQIGRNIYPITQGVIGRAWEKGEYCKNALPLDPSEYMREMTTLGYTENEVRQFTMNAHFIYAKRIEDSNLSPSGLIVVEMIDPVMDNSCSNLITQIESQIGAFSGVVTKFGEKFVELANIQTKAA